MSRRRSGLFGRLVVLIGGTAILIALCALLILRGTTADAAAGQAARSVRAQVVLADLLLADSAVSPDRADALLSDLDVRRSARLPESRFRHAPFWDSVAAELTAMLPGREVHYVMSRDPVMWVRRGSGAQAEWIGIPVAPLRSEVTRTVLIAAIAACLIVLVVAAAYARILTRPLRLLADSAPEIAAGHGVPTLPPSAAREFHALAAALDTAADAVRETASERTLMLAALSHDMRTPLARLRLASELAGMDEVAREGMHLDIDELDRLIGQCIDFARDGRDEPVERIDVVVLLEELVAAQRRSGFEWTLKAPANACVSGRPMALRRAVANLMENAGHHGKAPLTIECRNEIDTVLITVLDRGPGVDPSILGKLGVPFLQGAPNRAAGRNGLGLASARRVAAQHQGSIRYANRDGGGFAATLSIPSATFRSGS